MRFKFFTIILISTLVSCGDRELKKETFYSDKIISYTVEELNIPINSDLNNDYPYSSLYLNGNSVYFIGFNAPNHKLDVFNLNQEKYEFSIYLETDGPNKVGDPWDFYVHNMDSIFYLDNSSNLHIIDRNARVLNSINLNKQNSRLAYKASPISFKLHYSQVGRNVYFNSYSIKHLPKKSQYYQEPIITWINLENEKLNSFPITFPESYSKDGFFLGETMEPNVTFFSDEIFYSFPAEHFFYKYDIKNKSTEKYWAESSNTANEAKLMPADDYQDLNKRIVHRIENPYFYPLLKDPYRNLYYRIHFGDIPHKVDDLGTQFNSMTEKPEFLMVFDSEFKVITEIRLPFNRLSAQSCFVTNEGLFFPNNHYLNPDLSEDYLSFLVYKFENNN